MPGVEAKLSQFQAANTQVLGVSIDSIFSHANWGKDVGGVSFPLLADFHPKGEMAQAYGLYLAEKGITDRATVVIDAGGTVRYSNSVGPGGERSIDELLGICQKVNSEFSGSASGFDSVSPLPSGTLYVKSNCGFSKAALLARDNLHLQNTITVKNVSEQASAMDELKSKAGKEQAPCLVIDNKPMFESKDIVELFVKHTAPLA